MYNDQAVKYLYAQRNWKAWKMWRETNFEKAKQKTAVAINFQRRSFKQFS